MSRRLVLFALALSVLALPAFARRRAVAPGGPSHCVTATLASARYAQLLAADAQYVYFLSEFGYLSRVPKLGGEIQDLANDFEEWLPLSIAVDDTDVYIGALPVDGLFMPRPGSILKVPKSGGVVSVFQSGAITPFEVETDATHVYWASAGTLDFRSGSIAADGKVERVRKDGSGRLALAEDLSGSLGLALDGNDVYFGQAGIADGDPTVGLYRVAKTGGAITTIDDRTSVGPLVLNGDTIAFLGGTLTSGGVLAIEKSGATPVRLLYEVDSVSGGLQIADRRVYFLEDAEGAGVELSWVSLDAPAGRVGVLKDLDGDEFLLDGCAVVVNTMDGNVVRARR